MKYAIFALLASILAGSAIGGQLSSELDNWTTFYYLDPKPDEVEAALEEIGNRGYFEQDTVQAPLSGFFYQIFKNNPDRISDWIKPYMGVPERHIVYSALWMANSQESLDALERLAKAASPDEARNLRSLVNTRPPTMRTMAVDSPAVLDYFWGCFMASGSEIPVERIIDQVKLSNVTGNLNATLIGGAARWSLAANARQHPKVLQILKTNVNKRDAETREIIGHIIAEIEEKSE